MSIDSWPELEIQVPLREIEIKPRVDPLDLLSERYPRIAWRIKALWNSQELADQFNRWVFTDQEGRSGFSQEVIEALIELSNEHCAETGFVGATVKRDFPDRW
jgi:hypothetical protein